MSDRKTFKPEIVSTDGQYADVIVQLNLRCCDECNRPMVRDYTGGYHRDDKRSYWSMASIEGEDVAYWGGFITGKQLCEKCYRKPETTFKCGICGNERTVEQLHATHYGEHECEVCYETMTAKAWKEWHETQDYRNRDYYD